jgi:glycosyltransferase involved in cell wall biosynthesis
MASGRPVIAFGKGGALETVVENLTGMFFYEQTPECLIETVEKFEAKINSFSSEQIQAHADKFSKTIFKNKMSEFIRKTCC